MSTSSTSSTALNGPKTLVVPISAFHTGGRPTTHPYEGASESDLEKIADTLLLKGLSPRQRFHLQTLYRWLALAESRLYDLDAEATGVPLKYASFVNKFNSLRRLGLVQLVPITIASTDLMAAGLKPETNQRELRVWTLGAVGRMLAKRLWAFQFVPIGQSEHMAHHALAAEYALRYFDAARKANKPYDVYGPREIVVYKRTEGEDSKTVTLLSPDGMLVKRKPDGTIADAFVIEYHHEIHGWRAKAKIEAYDALLNKDGDAWRSAWGLPTFPKVIVVWRHHSVPNDYQSQLRTLAASRRAKYGENITQFRHIALADALDGNPLGFSAFEMNKKLESK